MSGGEDISRSDIIVGDSNNDHKKEDKKDKWGTGKCERLLLLVMVKNSGA